MAKTESTMLPLGTPAPEFALLEPLTQGTVTLDDVAGERGTLVMFICNHCPFVVHLIDALTALGHDYADSDIGVVAISSNDINAYPQDGPDMMAALAKQHRFAFPYLFDASQDIARAYAAACTPDFFLFDGDRRLVYRGQFDDSRPGNGQPITGQDLRAAMQALMAGHPISDQQQPSIGCNIKWRD